MDSANDKKSASRRMCSVPQCQSYSSSSISLHKFPTKDKKLCNAWKNILKIDKLITENMFVCSLHFTINEFTICTPTTERKRLRKGIVPSQKLPVTSHQKPSAIIDRSRRKWLNKDPTFDITKDMHTKNNEKSVSNIDDHQNVVVKDDYHKATTTSSSYGTAKEPLLHYDFKSSSEEKGTQTDGSYFLSEVLNSDQKINTFTGVDSKILKSFEDCTRRVAEENQIDCTNIALKLLLVMTKLKLNISFAALSILLGISSATCTRYFYNTIQILAIAVKPTIYWPSKEEILKNMPKCFTKYQNTRVVLDCTEISIQRSKCLTCRVRSYSHYKGTHTVKYLIGITPSGLISYVSSGYGGRSSDKAIFNKEFILDILDPNDAVMVDKGFMIQKECEDRLIKLIRPPFLAKNKQLSKTETEVTADIARARVHVERTIQRMKIFSIINETLDWYFWPHINEIVTVIAASVNISSPILADDKFLHSVDCTNSADQIDSDPEILIEAEDVEMVSESGVQTAPEADVNLKQIIVPDPLTQEFEKLASENTLNGIETCGILAGKLEKNCLAITHLIIPKQTGTPNTCQASSEEEIVIYQNHLNLFTIGWIHTHPTQSAFLSSIDLHTHCSYQMLLPEAIAIVCAPRYENGIFCLTSKESINYISKCRERGFHEHDTEIPLFKEANHIKFSMNVAINILDLRT